MPDELHNARQGGVVRVVVERGNEDAVRRLTDERERVVVDQDRPRHVRRLDAEDREILQERPLDLVQLIFAKRHKKHKEKRAATTSEAEAMGGGRGMLHCCLNNAGVHTSTSVTAAFVPRLPRQPGNRRSFR